MNVQPVHNHRGCRAFSLLEVMIAIGIFFVASFAILGLVSESLSNARRLERPLLDASAPLSAYSLTNKVYEGEESGDLADILGKSYSDYIWTRSITEVGSNHLYEVDYVLTDRRNHTVVGQDSTLLYRPQSPPGSLDGGNFVK